MFTGIIETIGHVKSIIKDESNLHFWIESNITRELKVDQSVAHNGVCLTVVEIKDDSYRVTAIDETLQRTNLGTLQAGGKINIERCMVLNGRLDGHIVQGHVDCTATVTHIDNANGSWVYRFSHVTQALPLTVEKGSITVNGVSLTVVDAGDDFFSVAIIPYTYEHTNFHQFVTGTIVNIEFDVLGKYVANMLKHLKN
ncbi:MAG TPA: riboflavin synthase [Bacteroidia bacterium]|nr:riboflavin synthase [Bacteroidia bacterium]